MQCDKVVQRSGRRAKELERGGEGLAAVERVAYAMQLLSLFSFHLSISLLPSPYLSPSLSLSLCMWVCMDILCLSSASVSVFLFAFVAFDAVTLARKLKLLQWHEL